MMLRIWPIALLEFLDVVGEMLIYIYEKQRKIYGHLTVAQYPNTRISF
jgi:hypothetical protein